ncbi:hypothetical protein [Gaetbulibacter aestuarii]|uniref:Secreted protein (Por secretion system target) n=1 Tax=Gaetbulibacter aestuarii TaxID=1502358 RepID=A0ABW7MZ72_9FLAO
MKKLLTNSILIATMFATVHSFAATATINNDLKPYDEGKMALTLENVSSGNSLAIKDSNGMVLYKELIKTSGTYKKGFDLTALPDGAYVFELDKDLEIKIIPFTVTANKVAFKKAESKSIFKPYIRQKDNKVLISKLALNGEPVKIDIYAETDGVYQLSYSETIKGVKAIGKVYALKSGATYKITLKSINKEFTTFINN